MIETKLNNRTLIVYLSGDVDDHMAREAREKIDKDFSRSNAKNIIFDFGKVNFMDSSGIGMIIGRYKMIKNSGGKVAAVNISSQLKKIFDISGLKNIVDLYDDLDAAMTNIN